ncbi:MAG: cobyrinate a,c-diamide synthase [Alistipes sp.]|nr:cobyrinate a,c-diamide synthase [Alistipes sp.]
MDRVLFAGTGSGTGKTTIVCGFLNEIVKRRFNVVSFKCGPDYIDPMFHRQVLGVPGYNLDSFFLEKDRLLNHFREKCEGKALAVLEGAMGYYDGAGFTEKGSAYEIASLTDTPVVLIVNAKGTGNSVCAIVKGFLSYRKNHHIRGVILNQVTERTYLGVKQELEEMGVVPCGFLNRLNDDLIFQNRHLGLDFTNSGEDLKEKISRLGEQIGKTLEVDKILEIAKEAADFSDGGKLPCSRESVKESEISVAVAYDEAFSFLYEENMELLRQYGIRPVFFSPLRDKTLPKDCRGLLLLGGYPESYAGKLSENEAMRDGIKQAVLGGMPVIAECGGYMYLKEAVEGTDGRLYPMTGVLRGTARKKEHLVRFGYVTLLAQKDNMLCKAGERIKAHEFHYWDCEENGDAFTAVPAGKKEVYPCIFAEGNLFAGYPHLYLLSNENVVENFKKRCEEYNK